MTEEEIEPDLTLIIKGSTDEHGHIVAVTVETDDNTTPMEALWLIEHAKGGILG